MATASKRSPQQIRDDRNARRRATRRNNARARYTQHAAFQLISYGSWTDGLPDATPGRVACKATAMYRSYLKDGDITIAEGEAALRYALEANGLPTSHLDQPATAA